MERQLKKVKIPGLSTLALSACLTFLKPVLNLQNSRPSGRKTSSTKLELSHATCTIIPNWLTRAAYLWEAEKESSSFVIFVAPK